ncbi:MAG TPA: RluA family pseudouridine synthase, partial [Clostridia bacterium]|nr:RluA family pseudouridine synthase [Clostridia bacterium]
MDASDRALERLVFAAEEEHKGMRADSFIAAVSNISRSQIKTVSSEFGLYLDEKQIKISYLVKAGDILTLYLPEPEELDLTPEDIPIDIVYEDDQLAVVNKQQGLTVHPSPTSKSHTLVNALLFRLGSLSGINGVIRPGIVHRLDKNTSGLLVVAKTDAAHRSLARQIATKSAKRIYLALLDGVLKNDEGIVDAPIGRNPRDRKTMAVVKDGKAA